MVCLSLSETSLGDTVGRICYSIAGEWRWLAFYLPRPKITQIVHLSIRYINVVGIY